jgi:hypothetical protein
MKIIKSMILVFISIVLMCSCEYDSARIKYAVVYDNGDKDTLIYIGPYGGVVFLQKGDLQVVNNWVNHKTMASGVRTFKIIDVNETK